MVTHPSWENAAFIAWDAAATALPLVPGSYVAKVGKGAAKIASKSKAIQKGTKYAKIAGSKISKGKALGKNLIKKATTALTKRVDLGGRKLLPRTRKALEKAAVHAGKSKYKSFTKGFTEWLNRGKKEYTVYYGVMDQKRVYTGITKQKIKKRLAQHRVNKRHPRNFDDLLPVYDNLTQNQAKAIEQYYIKNGPNKENIINSIGPKGKYKQYYNDALKWAEEYISTHRPLH